MKYFIAIDIIFSVLCACMGRGERNRVVSPLTNNTESDFPRKQNFSSQFKLSNEQIIRIEQLSDSTFLLVTDKNFYRWNIFLKTIKKDFDKLDGKVFAFKTKDQLWFRDSEHLICYNVITSRIKTYKDPGYFRAGLIVDGKLLSSTNFAHGLILKSLQDGRLINAKFLPEERIYGDFEGATSTKYFIEYADSIYFYSVLNDEIICQSYFVNKSNERQRTFSKNFEEDFIYFDEDTSLYLSDPLLDRETLIQFENFERPLKFSDFYIEGDQKYSIAKINGNLILIFFNIADVTILKRIN